VQCTLAFSTSSHIGHENCSCIFRLQFYRPYDLLLHFPVLRNLRFSQYNLGLVFHTIYSCIFHPCDLLLYFPLLHFLPQCCSIAAITTCQRRTVRLYTESHLLVPAAIPTVLSVGRSPPRHRMAIAAIERPTRCQ